MIGPGSGGSGVSQELNCIADVGAHGVLGEVAFGREVPGELLGQMLVG
ncbi:hypothetical protein GCM10027456_28050 [Kineosporia babensis]